MTEAWETIAQRKQQARDAQIPKEWLLKEPVPAHRVNVMTIPYECGIMTSEELKLTELDATELLEHMASGQLKSYNVTLAFCKRAAIAQQVINCVTDFFPKEALARANELDEFLARTGKPFGPYHGLPFSIKDQFDVKGKDTTGGYIAWVGSIAEKDAPVVNILRDAGAVFYVKTNNLRSHSNVFGRTLNPFNRNLSPGGSSGGEGAIVAFRGAPIGLAADAGGSIRCPAANCGLFGMKASGYRIPLSGCRHVMLGMESYTASVGPVCRTIRDNEHFFKVVLETEPWRLSPELVPVQWRERKASKKISIGYFVDDGVVRPHPPLLSAMDNLISKLRKLPNMELGGVGAVSAPQGLRYYAKALLPRWRQAK